MIRVITIVCFLFLVSNSLLLAQIETQIPVDKLKEDFHILRSSLEKNHAGLYTYTSKKDMDNEFDEIEKTLNHPMTNMDFFRKICPLQKTIGDSHTYILTPSKYMKALNSFLPRLPLAIHRYKDTIYVLRNLSMDESILPGTIIKSINGMAAIDLVHELANNVTRDAQNISSPEEKIIRSFNGYFAVFKGISSVFQLELIDETGKVRQVEIKGLSVPELLKNSARRYPDFEKTKTQARPKPLKFEIRNQTGIFIISSFSIPTIKKNKQNYKSFFKTAFAEIKSKNIQKVIIDLRDNGGGYPKVVNELYRYLSDIPLSSNIESHTITKKIYNRKFYEDGFWHYLDMRKSLRLRKDGAVYRVTKNHNKKLPQPVTNWFQGDLYVLMNSYTASAASDFVGMLKSANRGIFIGDIPGGSPHQTTSWIMPTLILPNTKIKVQTPLVYTKTLHTFEDTGKGILPDHLVKGSIEDVLNKRDAVMDFVWSLIVRR